MLIKHTVNKPYEYSVDVPEEQFLETLKKKYCILYRHFYEYSKSDKPDEIILENIYREAAKELYEKNPENYAN